MVDSLHTLQLDTYAKFTTQANVERSNTFARAICATKLYDIYYSGQSNDFTYMIAASTIVGPFPLVMLVIVFTTMKTCIRYRKHKKESGLPLKNTNHKDLVTLVLLGIYISIYILVLDILAVHAVRTSNHEYAPELAGRRPFNLLVSYLTLTCDILACILFLLLPLLYLFSTTCFEFCEEKIETRKKNEPDKKTETEKKIENRDVFVFLLLAPIICVTSHLGYILLAWITEPSKSTTTLILYYFILCYLYLTFRMSYKLGCKLHSFTNEGSTKPDHEKETDDDSTEQKDIDVIIFFVNLLLGIIYLGLAVIFIMVAYLVLLASDDLFSYLFNVIQFMIVVVSTQYAYTFFVGDQFNFKQVVKYVKNVTKNYKKEYEYEGKSWDSLNDRKDVSIVEETGVFLAERLLLPHMIKNKENIEKIRESKAKKKEENEQKRAKKKQLRKSQANSP